MKAKIAHHNITRINPGFSKTVYQNLKPGLPQMLYLRNTPKVIPHIYGDIVEHDDAYLLVLMGMAWPADDECIEAAGLTPEMIEVKIVAYAKQSKGAQTGIAAIDADPVVEAEDTEDLETEDVQDELFN